MLNLERVDLEGLADSEKAHYKKSGDKWVLEIDKEIKTDKDISKLTESLRKERLDHKSAKARLALFDKSPEEYEAIIQSNEELQVTAGKIDEEAMSKLLAIKIKPFEAKVSKLESTLATSKSENGELKKNISDYELEGIVRSVTDGKIDPLSVQDAILRGKTFLTKDEEGNFFDSKGNTAEEFFEQLIPKTNWAIDNGGVGAEGSKFKGKMSVTIDGKSYGKENNPFSSATSNMTEQSMIAKENPELAKQLMEMAD